MNKRKINNNAPHLYLATTNNLHTPGIQRNIVFNNHHSSDTWTDIWEEVCITRLWQEGLLHIKQYETELWAVFDWEDYGINTEELTLLDEEVC